MLLCDLLAPDIVIKMEVREGEREERREGGKEGGKLS